MDAGLYMRRRFSAVWGSWLRILSEDQRVLSLCWARRRVRWISRPRDLTTTHGWYALTVKAGGATRTSARTRRAAICS